MAKVFANGRSIVHQGDGGSNTCPTPDVCKTRVGKHMVPVPYVNTAKDSDLAGGTTSVEIEGHPVAVRSSYLAKSTGDEPGRGGGVISRVNKGKMTWITCSSTVVVEGEGVVRYQDACLHNGNKPNACGGQQDGKGAKGPHCTPKIGHAERNPSKRNRASSEQSATLSVRFAEIDELFIHSVGHAEVPEALVYQDVLTNSVVRDQTSQHLRTFVRERAKEINGKYVYVFSSKVENPRPDQLELCHELQFQQGSFQEVALEGRASRRGHDCRPVAKGAPRRHTLELPVGSLDEPELYYYFFLSPVQYPWKSLDHLMATLSNRASRLFDAFWTDISVGDAGRVPLDAQARASAKGQEQCATCHVYLLDPVAQALLRAEQAESAMQRWQLEVHQLGNNDTYRLAKRVNGLAGRRAELLAELTRSGQDLRDDIASMERPLARASRLARDACLNLVLWVGTEQRWTKRELLRQGPVKSLDKQLFGPIPEDEGPWETSKSRMPLHSTSLPWKRPSTEPFNELSQMVRDFSVPDVALPELLQHMLEAVHERLSEQALGRALIAKLSQAYTKGERPVADAGASVLFLPTKQRLELPEELDLHDVESAAGDAEVKQQLQHEYKLMRKALQLPPTTVFKLVAFYVPFLEYDYVRQRADGWGIPLDEIPEGDFKAADDAARKAREAARAAGVKGRLRPIQAYVLRALGGGCELLVAALDVWHVARLFNQLASTHHRWTEKDWLTFGSAMGSLLSIAATATKYTDAAGVPKAVGKLAAQAEVSEKALAYSSKLWRASKVLKPLALIGSFCDAVSGGIDLREVFDQDGNVKQTLGAGLRFVGGVLAVGGSTLGVAGSATVIGAVVGLALTVIGWGLQAKGSEMMESSSDAHLFLRYCQWGVARGTDSYDGKCFGYRGNLRDFARSLLAQHQALSHITLAFNARFVAQKASPSFVLDVETTKAVCACAVTSGRAWSLAVKIRVHNKNQPPKEHTWNADRIEYPAEMPSDPVVLRAVPANALLTTTTEMIEIIEAVITFNPLNDERFKVTRSLRNFWMSYGWNNTSAAAH